MTLDDEIDMVPTGKRSPRWTVADEGALEALSGEVRALVVKALALRDPRDEDKSALAAAYEEGWEAACEEMRHVECNYNPYET